MNDGQWRARAVAAETACAEGVEALAKCVAFQHPDQSEGFEAATGASVALAAMRAAAAQKGEARAKGSRRMRRSDALVLAQLAAGLLASGHPGSASAIARIAKRMAKLTGAPLALKVAEAVPESTEEAMLPAGPEREQIALYFEHLARSPIGCIDLRGESMPYVWGCVASWVRNRLDVKWAEEMRASGAMTASAGNG